MRLIKGYDSSDPPNKAPSLPILEWQEMNQMEWVNDAGNFHSIHGMGYQMVPSLQSGKVYLSIEMYIRGLQCD